MVTSVLRTRARVAGQAQGAVPRNFRGCTSTHLASSAESVASRQISTNQTVGKSSEKLAKTGVCGDLTVALGGAMDGLTLAHYRIGFDNSPVLLQLLVDVSAATECAPERRRQYLEDLSLTLEWMLSSGRDMDQATASAIREVL